MVTGTYFLALLVVLSCVSESWQRCFSYHCPHHSPLTSCISGSWLCQSNEFCEVETHLNHGNAPWVVMNCRPDRDIQNCWDSQAHNDPACDPNKHDRMCHWCCQDEQCVRNLAQGVFPTATAAPVTTTTTTVQMTTGDSTVTATTTAAVGTASTTSAGSMGTADTSAATTTKPCEDLYLGDCLKDYAGRCGEPLIAQLCPKSCNLCV